MPSNTPVVLDTLGQAAEMYQCAIDVLEAPRSSVADFRYESISDLATTATHPSTPFRPGTPFQEHSPMKRAGFMLTTPTRRMTIEEESDPFCVDTPFIPDRPPPPSPVRSPPKRPAANGFHSRAPSSVYSVHSVKEVAAHEADAVALTTTTTAHHHNGTHHDQQQHRQPDHLPSQTYLSQQTARAERQWRLARFDLEIRVFVRLVREHVRSVERFRAVVVGRQENMRFVAANEKVLRSTAAQTMREWRGEVERGLGVRGKGFDAVRTRMVCEGAVMEMARGQFGPVGGVGAGWR
jgi:hypothetical protein